MIIIIFLIPTCGEAAASLLGEDEAEAETEEGEEGEDSGKLGIHPDTQTRIIISEIVNPVV